MCGNNIFDSRVDVNRKGSFQMFYNTRPLVESSPELDADQLPAVLHRLDARYERTNRRRDSIDRRLYTEHIGIYSCRVLLYNRIMSIRSFTKTSKSHTRHASTDTQNVGA